MLFRSNEIIKYFHITNGWFKASYCLVAGGNVAYDFYKPALKPDAGDDELIQKTRWGVGLSWILGFVMAISFDQMLGLWVFMASILISSVLVPILGGLFFPKFHKPLAGLLSTGLGLASTIILNMYIMTQGTFVVAEETYVLYIGSWEIFQEYLMYITVPISFMGYILGIIFGKEKRS